MLVDKFPQTFHDWVAIFQNSQISDFYIVSNGMLKQNKRKERDREGTLTEKVSKIFFSNLQNKNFKIYS